MPTHPREEQRMLERFMWISIAASLIVIALKAYAAYVTGSVGFLSDALESLANVAAALVGLWALKLSAKPADENHNFGHAKAEYFAAQVEGSLILVASVAIIYTAVQRLITPQPVEQLGIGLLFSVVATLINLGVGAMLVRAGRTHRSSTLVADGKHLLTDVWTTVGVIVGMALVWLTGLQVLDPIVAILVGANILYTGYKLLREAIQGLLSETLPEEEVATAQEFLDTYAKDNGVVFTSLRTTAYGRQRLINVVMQVPGEWTVSHSHEHADNVEEGLAAALGGAETIVHIEPLGIETTTGPIMA
ncbi:cation diffusion facilitator family transporter [Corynebacterium sp. HMSC29G08]|uniref:cation diffusion facilitator family transporter n=1 Tax=Corynebacterium sp. HMSC29G08 TaxID=1581069 RepID=UPI0008A243E2|nr:cation diffusion facilitator family transporter [Corynebacterium sp. HMSC29G08]OFT84177.1 transporter [Corynebacterium sp. HMSC29G08]